MENFDEKWDENRHNQKIQDWKNRLKGLQELIEKICK